MPVWTAADVAGFLPAISLNVSFFKEQGERREAACAERQPKCGGKIIAPFLGGSSGLGLRSGRQSVRLWELP